MSIFEQLREAEVATAAAGGAHWLITRDHLYDEDRDEAVAIAAADGEHAEALRLRIHEAADVEGSAAGVEGPRDCNSRAPMPLRWRAYDDDGNLYYSGVMNAECYEGGADPLSCFAGPNAGAVRLDVWDDDAYAWKCEIA